MGKRKFGTLSLFLTTEILIGFGMFFGLQEVPAVPVAESKIEEIAIVQEEMEPAPTPIIVEPPPPPDPIVISNIELTPQGQLVNPPEVIRAAYLTSWSGGSKSRIDYVIDLAASTDLNAVVIDVKDFSGELAYDIAVPEVELYGAKNIKIWNLDSVIQRLHDKGIYVIARVTVFQDPILAHARPDLAVHSNSKLQEAELSEETLWTDYKGLGWIDPSNEEAWNYTVAIAKDVASRGFDEINFDYIRFPSDGDLSDMNFPSWDEQKPKHVVLRNFFAYLNTHVSEVAISADLFGLSTSSTDDLGIGQVIEDAYEYFDYVYPMVYPSHYAYKYQGFPKPAEYPYEVVQSSLKSASVRLKALQEANPEQEFAKIRPWLQDFDLGAEYDTLMVQAQIQATQDALQEDFAGYLLWAPTNYYTVEALQPFVFDKASYEARDRTTLEEFEEQLRQAAEEEAEEEKLNF